MFNLGPVIERRRENPRSLLRVEETEDRKYFGSFLEEETMFKVRATVVGFMGDEEKYPCHFQHKIGDEFIYDGERYTGRICPGFSAALIPRMMSFFAAGPRAVPR